MQLETNTRLCFFFAITLAVADAGARGGDGANISNSTTINNGIPAWMFIALLAFYGFVRVQYKLSKMDIETGSRRSHLQDVAEIQAPDRAMTRGWRSAPQAAPKHTRHALVRCSSRTSDT